MTGILFFAGTFLRWIVQNPRDSTIITTYLFSIHGIAQLAKFNPEGGIGLLFTISILAPLMLLIYKGLPTDCLNYKAAIQREREVSSTITSLL